MIPRILIFGRFGQVGWELCRTMAPMGTVVSVDYPEVDFINPDSLRKWVREVKPNILINAAAYTAVDKAESEPEKAMQINGLAPGILAEEAKRMGALLVHYSTDYVYDGTKSTPYIETDAPNPLNSYGRSKLAGDQAIQQVDGAYLIFRLCWVYGLRGANFLLTMFRLARERETLRVVQDQVGSPTWSRMIAEGTAMAARQACGAPDFSAYKGLYHLNSSGQTSWHGFTSTIVEKIPASLKKCQAVEPITTAEYPTPAKRPPYSVMSSGKLKDTFGLQLPAWADSLAMAMEDYLRDR